MSSLIRTPTDIMDICSSPWLFAAYHVLLRLLVPRHPPCALLRLTIFIHSVGCVWFFVFTLVRLLFLSSGHFHDLSMSSYLFVFFLKRIKIFFDHICSFQGTFLLALSARWEQNLFYSQLTGKVFFLIWRPPAFPHRLQCSIIGRPGLNHRVRDGNGCDPQAHRHQKSWSLWRSNSKTHLSTSSSLERRWSSRTFRYGYLVTTSPQLSVPP